MDVLNSVFTMGAMELSNNGKLGFVFIGSVLYTFSVLCNLALLLVIAVNKSLHEPMYMLLCHLIINDLIGISAMIPKVLSEIMSEFRYTSFLACLGQAFCIHIYGGATLFILSVMALDRYVAICYPLRYHTILTKGLVGNLIVCVWLVDIILITVLLGLMLRFPFCKTVLVNVYCDNVTLLQATCATDTSVNNIYGLFITGVYQGIGLFSVLYSYSWIIYTCFKNKDPGAKLKAINTCGTHLLVFLIYEITGIFIVLVYRFQGSPRLLQQMMGMLFAVVSPSLNPLIYGIKSKEIKVKLKQLFFQLPGTGGLKVQVNTVSM